MVDTRRVDQLTQQLSSEGTSEVRSELASEVISVVIGVVFGRERDAKIAFNSLRIDREVSENNKLFVRKRFQVLDDLLTIELKSNSLKQMRVCVKSVFHFLEAVIDTIDLFDISGQTASE